MIELLDGPDDPRWASALARCTHDVYQLPGWSTAHAPLDLGEGRAIVVTEGDDVWLCPVVVRPLDDERFDATSPYGYAGPVSSRPEDGAFQAKALASAAGRLADLGCVSWFIRLHPILEPHPVAATGELVVHGETIAVDLSASLDDVLAQIRPGHRTDIARAIDRGVTTHVTAEHSDIRAFAAMYRETMVRARALDFYLFDDTYFAVLGEQLGWGDGIHLRFATLGDEVIGGALFTVSASSAIAQYHLSATADGHRDLQPSKVILKDEITWTHANGLRTLHLGGGVGAANDGLYRFKAGFTKGRSEFATRRLVLDTATYDALCATADAPTKRFPAYRASPT